MPLEFKTVYLDMPEKRKYWVLNEKGSYDWTSPSYYNTGPEALDKIKQYHDTLTQCSTEKLRKIADAMGFHITEYIQEEERYRYQSNSGASYEDYYYPFCRSVQGYFVEMPDVIFKLKDTQYSTTDFWIGEYEGIDMYVLINNDFVRCRNGSSAFFGNFYDLSGTEEIYRDTRFKTSFFKIVDIAGGVHILEISNNDKRIDGNCHIINLFDIATHDWVDYGVTVQGSLRPISDSDKSLIGNDYAPVIDSDTSSVGTQKFITKMKNNEAWYLDVRGDDTTYRVGLNPKLNTPGNIPSVSWRYYIITLSNGIKIFDSGSVSYPIAFKD